jgi:hypothetical protein
VTVDHGLNIGSSNNNNNNKNNNTPEEPGAMCTLLEDIYTTFVHGYIYCPKAHPA